jgi:hypothetical protein
MNSSKNQPSEYSEQVALVAWLRMHGIPHFAVPNGGTRNIVEAARLKAGGVKKGIGDLIIFLPKINLSLEMKIRTGGRVSPEQREWQDFFNARPGWCAYIANGAQEAIKIINQLLTL